MARSQKLDWSELDKIKDDIQRFSDLAISEMTTKAKQDMIKAHDQIIDKFYASHKPKSYHRHGVGKGLYKSIYGEKTYVVKKKHYGWATVKVGNRDMDEHYGTTSQRNNNKISSANVFDLTWNKGVRGLPKKGITPLSHSFDWYYPGGGYMHWNAGDTWYNPYWSGESKPYHNIFRTKINIGKYSTKTPSVANIAMRMFVNDWGEYFGADIADEIWKNL